MSIIDRIKRLLGVADDDRGADASGAVTIERERSDADPATETEAAIKGTDAGAAVDDTADTDNSGTESTATDTEPRGAVDADTETDTTTEAEPTTAETTAEAEPTAADGETSDTEATTDETDEAGGTDETDETDEAGTWIDRANDDGTA